MDSWFENPKSLFDAGKVFEFWPTSDQTSGERVNSTTRFVIYATCIIYLIRRDIRIFILGAMVIGVLYILDKSKMVRPGRARPESSDDQYRSGFGCQMPSDDNPMGNVLLTDISDNPNRPQACYYPSVRPAVKRTLDDTFPYDAGRSRSPMPEQQRYAAARQFVSNPVTSVPGDQTGFAEWCYGEKFSPMCRDDPSKCDPNFRGAQLEAFSGLDFMGNKRSGAI